MSFIDVLITVVFLLLLAFPGFLFAKLKKFPAKAAETFTVIVLYCCQSTLVVTSFQKRDFDPQIGINMLWVALIALAVHLIMFAILKLVFIKKSTSAKIRVLKFASVFSNCGFMGIPLVNAIYHEEGVFYLTAFITVFNIVVWTHGVILISGQKDFKQVVKVFYSPTIISIVLGLITFFAQIRIPETALTALGYIKEINTPMAMIVSGVTIAATNVPALLKKVRVYYVCLLKLLVLPIALAVPLSLLSGVDETVRMTVLIAASAPPAAMCTLMSIRYGKNSIYSSEIFTAGTVLSVATLPLVVEFMEHLTKIF